MGKGWCIAILCAPGRGERGIDMSPRGGHGHFALGITPKNLHGPFLVPGPIPRCRQTVQELPYMRGDQPGRSRARLDACRLHDLNRGSCWEMDYVGPISPYRTRRDESTCLLVVNLLLEDFAFGMLSKEVGWISRHSDVGESQRRTSPDIHPF